MQPAADWGLIAAYWLHMLATVVWIGGLAALALLVYPALAQLPEDGQARLLDRLHARLQGVGWFSLLLLLGTGMFQMSANPNYEGLLAITNRWAAAILAKHGVYGGMIALSAYLTWGLGPAVRRAALRTARGAADSQLLARLRRREIALSWVDLALAVVVLLLTAIARAS